MLGRQRAAVPVPGGICQIAGGVQLHRAAATGQLRVIVGEGFFDCLKVHQAGFGSAVAPMGSALYEPQRRLLAKRFRQIVPMLDGDAAGRRASAETAARMAGRCRVKAIALAAAGPTLGGSPPGDHHEGRRTTTELLIF